MKNKTNYVWILVLVVLLTAAMLAVGVAYGRYRTDITGDLIFQAKPWDGIAFSAQQWSQKEGDAVLTFSMAEDVTQCRVFLAMSEGVTDPASVEVTLTIPLDSYEDEEGKTVTPEPLVLTAAGEPITEDSSLYALFGSGYVFRFMEEVEETEAAVELILDLETDKSYVLTVSGLDAAAEQTSLLRLFVENVQQAQ